jgi:hypothetical protein
MFGFLSFQKRKAMIKKPQRMRPGLKFLTSARFGESIVHLELPARYSHAVLADRLISDLTLTAAK